MIHHYCAGVLFNDQMSACLLIRKTKPKWQEGFLNAIGGTVEPLETPHDAMVREFTEETMLDIPTWIPVLDLLSPGGNAVVHFFKAFRSHNVVTMTHHEGEEGLVTYYPLDYLLNPHVNARMIPNLKWILPVMMAHGLPPFDLREMTRGGFPA